MSTSQKIWPPIPTDRLIRIKIPEHREREAKVKVRICHPRPKNCIQWIIRKLREELYEYIRAQTPEERAEELADLKDFISAAYRFIAEQPKEVWKPLLGCELFIRLDAFVQRRLKKEDIRVKCWEKSFEKTRRNGDFLPFTRVLGESPIREAHKALK